MVVEVLVVDEESSDVDTDVLTISLGAISFVGSVTMAGMRVEPIIHIATSGTAMKRRPPSAYRAPRYSSNIFHNQNNVRLLKKTAVIRWMNSGNSEKPAQLLSSKESPSSPPLPPVAKWT